MLTAAEGQAAEVINRAGTAPLVLVCEHASAFIPASFAGLGLDAAGAVSHAAWDIGARDVAVELSRLLDAPLVASRISRLVYDCNRPPDAPSAFPAKSEAIEVPGNRGLSAAEKRARTAAVYAPFQSLLREVIAERGAADMPPCLVTIHSFTPVFNGAPRAVELGLLHDQDARMAQVMLEAARNTTALKAALNAPYDASDGVLHSLQLHATSAGLASVMIEIRNDLIDTEARAAAMAGVLAPMIDAACTQIAQERGASLAQMQGERE